MSNPIEKFVVDPANLAKAQANLGGGPDVTEAISTVSTGSYPAVTGENDWSDPSTPPGKARVGGVGVFGKSSTGIGVSGESDTGVGVQGISDGNNAGVVGHGHPGILGKGKVAGEFQGDVHVTGNVGIGTDTPAFKLDVADRMRVREGVNSAGIWLYQKGPQADRAFVGMADDKSVGLWGNTGAGWGLKMDITTGDVGIGMDPDPDLVHVKLNVSNGHGNGVRGFGETSNPNPVPEETAGIRGFSSSATGVIGQSTSGHGVVGTTYDANHAGVYGTNHGPGLAAHFVGRIRVAEGTNGTAGIWLFQNGPKADQAFVGMADDKSVGFYGNTEVVGWGLTMDTTTGDINIPTGNINLGKGDILLAGADCAEQFDTATGQQLEPGTVVVLDETGSLRESWKPYDKKVAGVISGAGTYRPGIILDKRSSDEGRASVALVGKVYCKVDAQPEPIEVGDLLTTSSLPGYAMKASDPVKAFGAVIGKALRPIQEGQGLIPVLIALQ